MGTGTVRSDVPSQPCVGLHFVIRGVAGTGAPRIAYAPKKFGIF